MKVATNHFVNVKAKLEEKLMRKDNTHTQSTQAPMKTSFPISTLKNINSRYWGKVVPILCLLNSIQEYVLYYERKIEEYKVIFYLKSRVVKISMDNAKVIKIMNHKYISYTCIDNSHEKILAMSQKVAHVHELILCMDKCMKSLMIEITKLNGTLKNIET